jgi:mRNA-degrading endonuclease RelE of RelBE toxin-antitoxin system
MRYEILLSPEAVNDLKHLAAGDRSAICDTIKTHLRYEPQKTSKSRIKRLRGVSRPEYRLRIGEFRIFYDVQETEVQVLAIVPKHQASEWLERYGEPK